jgi:hypothetical protein
MDIHCTNGWIFHEWKNNKCERCGIPTGMNWTDVTWGDDPSLFGVPSQAPLADLPSRRGSMRPRLQLVRVCPVEDDSSSAHAACDPVS